MYKILQKTKLCKYHIVAQILSFCIYPTACFCAATTWQVLSKGIQYQDINQSKAFIVTPWSHIHIFKIDLKYNQLDLMMASELHKSLASAEEFAQHSSALIAINGGFFDAHNQPLGLRRRNHINLHASKKISWWGFFYLKDKKPFITNLQHISDINTSDIAIQAGPRLIINGHIPHLKPGYADRTAIGVTAAGKIILLVTENAHLTTTDLANILLAPLLNCINAINLDGGKSSQLYANIGTLHIFHSGFAQVSDAIIIR